MQKYLKLKELSKYQVTLNVKPHLKNAVTFRDFKVRKKHLHKVDFKLRVCVNPPLKEVPTIHTVFQNYVTFLIRKWSSLMQICQLITKQIAINI